jgi:hypothetical protein
MNMVAFPGVVPVKFVPNSLLSPEELHHKIKYMAMEQGMAYQGFFLEVVLDVVPSGDEISSMFSGLVVELETYPLPIRLKDAAGRIWWEHPRMEEYEDETRQLMRERNRLVAKWSRRLEEIASSSVIDIANIPASKNLAGVVAGNVGR